MVALFKNCYCLMRATVTKDYGHGRYLKGKAARSNITDQRMKQKLSPLALESKRFDNYIPVNTNT